MTKGPCKFHLLQGACSSPVVCSAPLFLPCSLQGYRLRCLCPGRNAAWPQRAAASCVAQPRVGCGHDALQIRDLTELRRLVGACLKPALPKQNADLRRSRISGAPRRADTVRAGLQERVRRVVLHRIRDTHTILADQWRHECDANISIIARDLSSARFIGARSASPRYRSATSREAWSTRTSASSDLSINVRRVGKGARRTFYTISASLTARAVPTRQWWARHAILRVARP